jgi:mannose/cellobiose epimerase-like protein (N-acyl-D-glucosamine 2-epimerase family)
MPRPGCFAAFALAAMLFALPPPAGAWGVRAHRVVADLAARQLRPAARAEVARLLAGEADPTLAGVSNWADDLREHDAERGPATSRWHFVNFPEGDCTYVPARDCPDGRCVIAAINRQFLVLSDTARPDGERAEALKFLVHLVADVHQPLHAAHADDRGGNRYQLSYAGEGTNLHSAWDALLPKRRGLAPDAYADYLAALAPLPDDPTRRSDRPAVDWAVESCALAQAPGFYPPGHVLEDAYLDAQLPVAELRMRLAGQRLADMLNFALARPATAQATP